MSVKRYQPAAFSERVLHASNEGKYVSYEDYAALEQKLAESHRALRAETTAHENTQMQLEKMSAENAGLKSAISNTQGAIELACAGINDDRRGDVFRDILNAVYIKTHSETPSTDSFLAEVRAQALTNYADKRGFSFQHGSIHAHFGNGDVLVGATKFENSHAGICFAPVREKEGGVGTEYKWTEGKNTEQVNSVFVISSSSAEGLEVIRDKLSEAIDQLRKGVRS